MSLANGTRLGPYEIMAAIGAGAMGEVYSARDTRLERTVAIKVLRADLARDPMLRQRFEREARAVSSLNHAHICALYDIGSQAGVDFIVMELLEGETLFERLEKGPLAFDVALRTAIQIADALSRAHAQGVVHRDLKPGNVMLTKSGAKLLDFGLAKIGGVLVGGDAKRAREAPQLTEEGTLLGTLQYMAPEQLHGKEADARSDIFALGALLYEMLTGERAFQGESTASVIAAILNTEPRALSEMQPLTPPSLERAVKRSLAKDSDDRWQNARDLMHELEWILRNPMQVDSVAARTSSRERVTWTACMFAALALGSGLSFWFTPLTPPPQRGEQLSIARPPSAPFFYFDSAVISPDGQRVAFVAYTKGSGSQLWVRSLDDESPRELEGTEGARDPFWSPDSRFLGFFAGGKLQRIDSAGGPAQIICQTAGDSGGTWGADGTIVFSHGVDDVLARVSASGGEAVVATRLGPNEEAHRWPCFLPDGKHFIFLGDAERTADHHLKLGSLDSPDSKELMQVVSDALYAAPGYLLYVRGGDLLAQHWDAKTLSLTGDPLTIASRIVDVGANHHFEFSVSNNGVLTFRSADTRTQLRWMDRQTRNTGAIGDPGRYGSVSMSLDAKSIAYEQMDVDGRPANIWTLNLERGTASRVTTSPGTGFKPILAPDGDHIAFGTYLTPNIDISMTRLSHPGERMLLLSSKLNKIPLCWSADSSSILFNQDDHIWVMSCDDPANAHSITAADAKENYAQLSADGRWLAFSSNISGREEIFVQPYPTGKRMQVSSTGGDQSRWRADGRELIYFSLDHHVMSVDVTLGNELSFSAPKDLFDLRGGEFCGVSPDGARFLVTVPVEDPLDAPLSVVLGWNKSR